MFPSKLELIRSRGYIIYCADPVRVCITVNVCTISHDSVAKLISDLHLGQALELIKFW